MIKRILHIAAWIFLFSGIVALLGFADKKQEEQVCQKLSIYIDKKNDHYFIEESDIKYFLREKGDTLVGTLLKDINIGLLENLLKNNPYIENAEVYSTIDGEVKIDVTQRNPVVRIFNSLNESYYLDEHGKSMPLCTKYTARVLVANGAISEKTGILTEEYKDTDINNTIKLEIFKLSEFIRNNEFWNACIEQIFISSDSQIELIPRIGNHRIIFGNTNNMEDKFNKLFLFYKNRTDFAGWKDYTEVNVSYNNQIVCKLAEETEYLQ